jgi:hypothetical protein
MIFRRVPEFWLTISKIQANFKLVSVIRVPMSTVSISKFRRDHPEKDILHLDNYMGHVIYKTADDEWFYADDHNPVTRSGERPCMACGLTRDDSRHDPCIKNLPHVRQACCGHGLPKDVGRGYIGLKDGRCYYFDAMTGAEIRELVRKAMANEPISPDIELSPNLSWWADMTDRQFDYAWVHIINNLDRKEAFVEEVKAMFTTVIA